MADCARVASIMNHYGAVMLGRAFTDQEEDCQFIIDEIGKSFLQLSSFMGDQKYDEVFTSPEALEILKEGWGFSGVLGEKNGKSYVMEVWMMYP